MTVQKSGRQSIRQETSVKIKKADPYRDRDNELTVGGQPVMTSFIWLWDGNKCSLSG